MENLNFLKNGVTKLPPGFRFQPTDEELVFQYLRRKIFSFPLPASIIPEINVFKHDPWDLPGDLKQERYFFSNKEAKYKNGKRSNRATNSGYWKATGLDKEIVASRICHEIVGMKKTLVFYRGKAPFGSRTDWIMHEYRLQISQNHASFLPSINKNLTQNSSMQMDEWVLCRIFPKKRSEKLKKVSIETKFFDFMNAENTNFDPISSCSSSCSSSSSITEVSSNESDSEASTASRIC